MCSFTQVLWQKNTIKNAMNNWTINFWEEGFGLFKEMKGTWRFDSELPRKHLRVFNFTGISPRNCQESRRSSSDGSTVKVPSSKTWNMKPSEETRCKSISLAFMRILIILAPEASPKRSNKQGDVICLKHKNNNSNFDDWLSLFFGWPMMTPIYKLWEPRHAAVPWRLFLQLPLFFLANCMYDAVNPTNNHSFAHSLYDLFLGIPHHSQCVVIKHTVQISHHRPDRVYVSTLHGIFSMVDLAP